jgi:hypothetical protein
MRDARVSIEVSDFDERTTYVCLEKSSPKGVAGVIVRQLLEKLSPLSSGKSIVKP